MSMTLKYGHSLAVAGFIFSLSSVGCSTGSSGTQMASLGPAGGTIQVGHATLTLPVNALGQVVEVQLRETAPRHAGRALRFELEPRGLVLSAPARLAFGVDDRGGGRVKVVGIDDSAEHALEVEVEDAAHDSWKTSLDHLSEVEVEIEAGATCATACATNEECDDGVCKPHVEDAGSATCTPVCASGLECDDGACKAHGGHGATSTDGGTASASCVPTCATGLECDNGVCKAHGGGK